MIELDFNIIFPLLRLLKFLNDFKLVLYKSLTNCKRLKKGNLKRFTFYFKLIDYGERPNKKNLESLDLTRKVNFI